MAPPVEMALPDVHTQILLSMPWGVYVPNIKSLYLLVSEIWTIKYFGSHFENEGGQNLISLSPLRDAPVYEVAWLWFKYFLLYCGNKVSGRMEGRTD